MPSELEEAALVLYRSSGLGIYGAVLRWAGMPLERIAIIMNSSQVSSAKGDLARLALAIRLTFADGGLAPYRVVGRASLIAWSLQYSVMGFVFMICDASLSRTLGIPRVVYGDELMQPAGVRAGSAGSDVERLLITSSDFARTRRAWNLPAQAGGAPLYCAGVNLTM